MTKQAWGCIASEAGPPKAGFGCLSGSPIRVQGMVRRKPDYFMICFSLASSSAATFSGLSLATATFCTASAISR